MTAAPAQEIEGFSVNPAPHEISWGAPTCNPMNNETENNHAPTHEEIAALAQRIYEEEGCPAGRAEAHWHEAERRLREQSAGVVVAGADARARASG